MDLLHGWRLRLRRLLQRQEDAELDEELTFHLDRQTEANLAAGMKSQEARRQARIAFGGVEGYKEGCHEERPGFLFERFVQDLRYALRGFRRNPLFTLTALGTLTLGIGATTAVFSVVDRILFRSPPYAYADRIVSVGMVHAMEPQGFLMGNFYSTWRDHQRPFDAMTSESTGARECDLTEGTPAQLDCDFVEGNFLATLGVVPVLGRSFLPEEARPGGPQVALLSYRVWLAHYNLDPGILNKTIKIDGNPIRVIGVLPREFEMPRLQNADVLRPIQIDEAADHTANGGYGSPRRAFARLKPGVTVEQARAAMGPLFEDASKQIPAEVRKDIHLSVRLLRDVQTQNVRLMAWVLLGSVASVLLIACANVASLLMARGAMRQKELAIRAALGASRARLLSQALMEAVLLSILGAGTGCLLAEGLLRLFVAIAPAGVPFLGQAQLDLRVISFTVAVSLFCGLLFGLLPALQRPNSELLTGHTANSVAHASMRQWLVAGQIAVSMILLAAAALLVRSFQNLDNQRMGMRVDNTVTASVTLGQHHYPEVADQTRFFEAVESQLRYGPGVSAVAVTDSLPPGASHYGRWLTGIVIDGQPPLAKGNGEVVTSRWVSPDYFRVLDIPVLRGRGFREEDVHSNERPVILSQTLATRLFPRKNPLGERLQFDPPISGSSDPAAPWYTVIGVAGNVKNSGLVSEDVPEFYRLRRVRSDHWDGNGTWSRTGIFIVRSSLPEEATAQWIRSRITAVDPTLPVEIRTVKQSVSRLADQPRFQTALVGLFALEGLILAVIGLYGVISFLVVQRSQEIGVRMALGATRNDILRLVMGRSLRLLLSGIVAGFGASLAVSRMLSHLLFSIGPHDPLSYGLVIALLGGAGLLATLIPARSAMKVDPAVTLRSE